MRENEFSGHQYLAASTLAALLPSGLVLTAGVLGFVTAPIWTTGTELDDAPMRVVGAAFIIFLPMFLFYLLIFYLSTRILASSNRLTRGTLACTVFVVTSIVLYWETLKLEGLRLPSIDELWSFGVFCLIFGTFSFVGASVWWWAAHNKAMESDA